MHRFRGIKLVVAAAVWATLFLVPPRPAFADDPVGDGCGPTGQVCRETRSCISFLNGECLGWLVVPTAWFPGET